jgi:NAD(P)-dependent dehydrogenase (short-subunit alcohol dehydrogenase family)
MSPPGPRKVAIITGASQGIGAGLVAGFRASGYAVVGTSRSIRQSDESGYLTVQGDISEAKTARRVVEQPLDRFGRIGSLINNAGLFIGKPFTEYTSDDYAAITAVNPGRVLPHHPARDPAHGRPGQPSHRQHRHQHRRPPKQRAAISPSSTLVVGSRDFVTSFG